MRKFLLCTMSVVVFCVGANAQTTRQAEPGSNNDGSRLQIMGDDISPAQKKHFAEYFLSEYSVRLVPFNTQISKGVIAAKLFRAELLENNADATAQDRRILERRILFYDGKSFKSLPNVFGIIFQDKEKLPGLLQLFDKNFKLKSNADAKRLQRVLDKLYPVIDVFPGRYAGQIQHEGNQWLFLRATFFKNYAGFVFTTDDGGAITEIHYSLKIHPNTSGKKTN